MNCETEGPQFFKIILDKTLQERKLRIPPKFVTIYGNDIPSKIVVEDPAGVSWEIGVSRCSRGEVWMHKGWDKFAEHYSIRHGHFLVFQYEGNGHFHVVIFDMSASEIDYPYYVGTASGASGSKGGFQEHNTEDVEFLGSKSKRRKSRENSHLPYSLPRKKTRQRLVNEDITDTTSAENDRDFRPSITSARGAKYEAVPEVARRCETENVVRCLNQPSLYAQRKAKALQQAQAFVSENPFCIVVMRPSYIDRAKEVRIPIAFAKEHLGLNPREVVLKVSNRSWTVKYKPIMSNGKIRRSALFSKWKCFVQNNNLKTGDVCVFELLKGAEINLKVTIFRVMEEAKVGSSGSADDDVSIEILENNSTSKKDRGKLPSYHSRSSKTMRMETSGKIKGKSSLLPEYYEAEEPETNETRGTSGGEICIKSPLNDEKAKANERLSSSKFEYPTFAVTMLPAYVNPGQSVPIPVGFCRKYLMNGRSHITLCTSDGKTWSVRVLNITSENPQINRGWKAFVEDNKLLAGDICVFKLMTAVLPKESILKKNAGSEGIENPMCSSNEGDVRNGMDFVSKDPFFKVVLPEYAFVCQGLYLPAWFVENFDKKDKYVTLRVNGDAWAVKLVRSTYAGRLCAGWAAFCRGKLSTSQRCLLL